EFGFVLLSFTVANAVIPAAIADQLLLVVALSMLLTPALFILYDRVFAAMGVEDQEREADEMPDGAKIIIAGAGRIGGLVNRIAEAAGYQPTVIDYSSKRLEILKKFGVKHYYGDATRPDLLASAGIERARILVVALDEREQIDKLVRYACANFPDLHVVARAKDRDHVYHLWAMGCRDIVRETYDSSLRMGRSVYEALGYDRQAAIAMVEAFETMDRTSMREVADTYRLDIPAYENEELLAKIRELKAEWDPKLREAMDEIAARGR
ncbi:MAG: NAD-binding protein, partial [Pseudomonadota bacterium]|nr:NAD-binding protein [Pseudomonadota bacterium]